MATLRASKKKAATSSNVTVFLFNKVLFVLEKRRSFVPGESQHFGDPNVIITELRWRLC